MPLAMAAKLGRALVTGCRVGIPARLVVVRQVLGTGLMDVLLGDVLIPLPFILG